MQRSKTKHDFCSTFHHQVASSDFCASRISVRVAVDLESVILPTNIAPLSCLSCQLLSLSTKSYDMRHPFGQFVLSVPPVSPPKPLPGPSLVAIVWEFGKDSLDNVGVLLSNSQNIINNLPTTSKSKLLHGVL